MHVDPEIVMVRILDQISQIIERYRAHTVGRDTNPGRVSSPTNRRPVAGRPRGVVAREGLIAHRVLADARATDKNISVQPLQILQENLRTAFNESRLPGVWVGFKTRARISDAEQSNPQANIPSGADNFFCQQIRMVVR